MAIWTKIAGIFGRFSVLGWLKGAQYYLFGAVLAALLLYSGMQRAMITRQAKQNAELITVIAQHEAQHAILLDITNTQKAGIQQLVAALQKCEAVNEQLRNNSRLVSDELARTKRDLSSELDKDRRNVVRVLQDEECADIALPSDISSVLRARAASANGS